ncbi:MAG: dihydrodipicolinate synthase family protein [Verrucomicrobiota bacterium]
MTPIHPLHGLVAATHTPFHDDGPLNLNVIEPQAAHLTHHGVGTVFIGGTTGECHSLTLQERLRLSDRWLEVCRASGPKVVVHVGSNCLIDARTMAERAEERGAAAIAAFAPSYFKPASLEVLVSWCGEIAAAAPATPFYFYDFPAMTGVAFPMPDFLAMAGERIPTLAGLKFTNPDLVAYQFCLRAGDGLWDLPSGVDEHLLAALTLGARGAVGSGFNFAAPIFNRLLAAFAAGDTDAAREEQFRVVRLGRLLSSFGYMAGAKAVMEILGVPVGPPRAPHVPLSPARKWALRRELESMGFFEWVA